MATIIHIKSNNPPARPMLKSNYKTIRNNIFQLVEIWSQMKRDKERHLQMLREALEKEAKEEKLSK